MTDIVEVSAYEFMAREFDRLAILRKMWSGGEVAGIIRRMAIEDPREALIASQAARIRELEEGLIGTTASLVATVSLLERGGKRAAPSDKMFTTMLADYNASIESARSLLPRKGGE